MENLDDLLLDDFDIPNKSCKTSHVSMKTPKLRRNHCSSVESKARTNEPRHGGKSLSLRSNLRKSKPIFFTEQTSKSKCEDVDKCVKYCEPQKNDIIEFDDDLDDVIVSQALNSDVYALTQQPDAKTEVVTPPPAPPPPSEKKQQKIDIIDLTLGELSDEPSFTKIKTTKSYGKSYGKTKSKMSTPKVKRTLDLVDLDDGDDFSFDAIIMDLDDEFKCKSQESPRLVPDQRNLRSRCHTSPLPVNSKVEAAKYRVKHTLITTETSCGINKPLVTCSNKINTFTVNKDSNNNNTNKSFIDPKIATQACKRQFVPPSVKDMKFDWPRDNSHLPKSLKTAQTTSLVSVNSMVDSTCDINQFPADFSMIEKQAPALMCGEDSFLQGMYKYYFLYD